MNRSIPPDKAFNSLDVQRATAFGWETHRGVSQNEMRVITFIASRGTRSEPGYAFSWFPIGGQNWWAAMMAIPHSSLRKVLMSLRKKGLLRDIDGSTRDTRFSGVRGYGIPDEVLAECRKWWQSRQDMVYTKVPDTPEQVFDHVPLTEQKCSVDGTTLFRTGTSTPPESITPGQVSDTYQWSNQGVTNLLTESGRPSGFRCSTTQETFVRPQEDDWEVPKDERETPRSKRRDDGWAAPKESFQKSSPRRPAGRLADLFDSEWNRARETHLMLSVPWSAKTAFYSRMNDLLEKGNTEEEIAEMIRTFFRLIGSNRIPLRSDELWRDFWNNRAVCLTVMREQSSSTVSVDAGAELKKLERLRAKTR